MSLAQRIEAILFFKGEPVSTKRLSEMLSVSEEEVLAALTELESSLSNRGITLMRKEKEVMLATAKDASELIAKVAKEELSRELGRAGLETLTIVLYRSPISRREIDYIRGVNSAFIVRNLMVRGLVERIQNEKDERVFLYKPTFELLSYLGISRVEDLPEYETVRQEIESSQKAAEEQEKEEQPSLL
ncbi:MAG: SMC-Scp complex subunit ScpB [Patescibacteria group bacterium]|nr:SMC-Scp complex subunit ScpB [bacterium]MDZ4240943.1 SMC-Scp complex subunit ScpB [Patescibacteria group bacterium]